MMGARERINKAVEVERERVKGLFLPEWSLILDAVCDEIDRIDAKIDDLNRFHGSILEGLKEKINNAIASGGVVRLKLEPPSLSRTEVDATLADIQKDLGSRIDALAKQVDARDTRTLISRTEIEQIAREQVAKALSTDTIKMTVSSRLVQPPVHAYPVHAPGHNR
jgi:hypothetical protein